MQENNPGGPQSRNEAIANQQERPRQDAFQQHGASQQQQGAFQKQQGGPFQNHPAAQSANPAVVRPAAGGLELSSEARTYLKQIYSLVAASLFLAVLAGSIGMESQFAHENRMILFIAQIAIIFIAFKVQNTPILFLFAGVSGFALGPIIAMYVGAGMSHIVGQAAMLTGIAFGGLTVYALTTKRDLSMMAGMLFAGLLIIVVGGLLNAFFIQSPAMQFAMAAMGAVIFSGYIVYETQQYKNNPGMVAPSMAALSMYLNIINLFISLLQILGFMGGDD